jgi:hypothetical protein
MRHPGTRRRPSGARSSVAKSSRETPAKAETAYNKYKLRIKNLRILKEPVSFAQIKVLVGGSDSVRQTNIWKGTQLNYARPFVTGDDKAPVERFNIWAKSLL